MARPKPSPVKLVCTRPWKDVGDDMLICRWTCPRGGGTVQFRYRWRADWYAILHPSTKERGKWQVSTFDKDGPIGDVIRTDCATALYDAGIGRDWKIEQIGREGLGSATLGGMKPSNWSRNAPKTKRERRALLDRCGARAFLQPSKLKFPIMRKSGPCVPDCAGLRAAKSRAAQYGYKAVEKKAAARGARVCRR